MGERFPTASQVYQHRRPRAWENFTLLRPALGPPYHPLNAGDATSTSNRMETSMKRPLVILIGADKGGVGKTTVARAVDDYLQSKRANRKIYDSEWPSGDLQRFVPSSDVIDIENIDHQMKVFDTVDGVTLLDVRAGLLSPTLRALGEGGLLDDVRSGSLALALLHVIGPSVASLREISETAISIGGGVRHFLVKNYVNESGFTEWEKDPRFAAVLKAAEPHTITIPHLAERACTEVQIVGGSFEAFAANRARSKMLSGYVRKWLDATWAEFERVGLGTMIDAAVLERPRAVA